MFKKTQKYLLLHYPLLWNIKIIPMGLIVLGLNLLFFFFGYISGKIDFQETYNTNQSNIIFFFIAGFTSVLTLIIWLIFYLKNNAFKSFYPKKSISLYGEWILIFIMITGNTLYCFSYYQGLLVRQRTQVSYTEFHKAEKLLQQIGILIPESDTYYYTRTYNEEPEESAYKNKDSVSISLLNYNNQDYYTSFISYSSNDTINYYTVKQWLIEGKKDSIKLLIQQYLDLQKKHKLETNLTADKWFNLIYHFPDFPVNSKNYISREKPDNILPGNKADYYVQYRNLTNGYRQINVAFDNSINKPDVFILITLYISLFISIALLSFRVTSGKSWLISLIVAGLLIFIFGITIAISETINTYSNDTALSVLIISYWSILFIIMILYLAYRIFNRLPKRKSPIILNLGLWLLPALPLIIYASYMNSGIGKYNNKGVYMPSGTYELFRDHPTLFLWINLIFVIIILLFLMKPIKEFRALPEE